MKKIFLSIVALCAFTAASIAETIEKREHFSSFSSIEIRDSFEATVQPGTSYEVVLNVDKRVSDYCRMYVQGTNLIIELDEKSYPKELKSQLKKKDSAPLILLANISMPVSAGLSSIKLTDASILASVTDFNLPQQLEIVTEGTAKVKSFDVKAPEVTISSTKKSSVQANVNASEVNVSAKQNANVALTVNGSKTNVSTENSAIVNLDGTSSSAEFKTSGSSRLNVMAKIGNVNITGKNSSYIDAHSADIANADVDLTSSSCEINPTEALKITLSSNAKLIFGGSPVVDIQKIASSSVTRAADVKDNNRR